MLLLNCSSTSTEVPEELAASGKPATDGARVTSEQVVPSADPKEPTIVEMSTEQRASEQVPPEAPSVEQAAPEERRYPEPRQEALEQSIATPSTQEGGLPDAVAQGKGGDQS
jgi:histidinol-phosphate/aromatic aminotransferase/cobyric acid decarboxylase-like protein